METAKEIITKHLFRGIKYTPANSPITEAAFMRITDAMEEYATKKCIEVLNGFIGDMNFEDSARDIERHLKDKIIELTKQLNP